MGMRILLLSALAALAFSCATAQNYPKKEIDGKDYYLYYVEPGNTLFAISKMFAVKVDDLIEANPKAEEGLEIGMELRVPVKAVDKRTARKSDIDVEGDEILHTVQKKETLFSIARDYGVNPNDLMELNPEQAKTLSTGAVIRIPATGSDNVAQNYLEPARNDSFIVHRVKSGETLYSLSKSYEISQDSLLAANERLEEGLKVDQFIIIPKYNESYRAALEERRDSISRSESIYPVGSAETYNIGLMLPFELEFNDSLEKALRLGQDLYILTEIALEYYRGTQLALDSLAKLGLNANVFVYDVGEDIVKARETLQREELDDLHLIFGPMHKAGLAMVSEKTKEEKIYHVAPNSFSNEVFEDNPFLIRSTASEETLLRYLANYIAINHMADNVLMINDESPKGWPLRKTFIASYNRAAGTFPNAFSDSLRSITSELFVEDADGQREVEKFLRKDTLNVFVVPSNDLAFVSDIMTRISRIDDYEVQVYGLDKWINYENIEASYKNRLRLRLVLPSYVNYAKDPTIEFLKNYRKRYGTEPAQFDYGFKGYDLTLFFGMALLKYGLEFPLSFDDLEMEGTSGNFRFGKSTSGREFENKAAFIMEYNDFQLKRVN
jgi:LysM repeat protein